MRITNADTIARLQAAIKVGADIADGTFMVVQQQWKVELTVYAINDEFPLIWEIEIGKLPERYFGSVCNSSYATGDTWHELFTEEHQWVYFDDANEAHRFMADFIMAHQIGGV